MRGRKSRKPGNYDRRPVGRGLTPGHRGNCAERRAGPTIGVPAGCLVRFGAGRAGGENVAVERGAGLGPSRRPLLVGRAPELGELEGFLGAGPAGQALAVGGEPGIGKSTVWEAGVGLARSRDFVALCARPGEAEAQLSFAGLADLLEGAGGGVLAGLPVPQRHALEVAVRRAEPGDQPPEPLAIAAGLLEVFRRVAEAGPVLVAVDDLPWLDQASAGALVFAARRLAGHDVRSSCRGAAADVEDWSRFSSLQAWSDSSWGH